MKNREKKEREKGCRREEGGRRDDSYRVKDRLRAGGRTEKGTSDPCNHEDGPEHVR